MLFLALPSLRARWVSFIGVLITVAAAVTLMTATGVLLEAGVRGAVPPNDSAGPRSSSPLTSRSSRSAGPGDDRETVRSDATERARSPIEHGLTDRFDRRRRGRHTRALVPRRVDRRRRHATPRSGGRPVARALVGQCHDHTVRAHVGASTDAGPGDRRRRRTRPTRRHRGRRHARASSPAAFRWTPRWSVSQRHNPARR